MVFVGGGCRGFSPSLVSDFPGTGLKFAIPGRDAIIPRHWSIWQLFAPFYQPCNRFLRWAARYARKFSLNGLNLCTRIVHFSLLSTGARRYAAFGDRKKETPEPCMLVSDTLNYTARYLML